MASTNEGKVHSTIHRHMVDAALAAPSPDNNQPWLFEETANGLSIYLDPSRSLPSDVESMFDMTAIGAAAENAILAASQHHLQTEIDWLADKQQGTAAHYLIAELRLSPGGMPDSLFDAIHRRTTCRKPYAPTSLNVDVLDQLAESCQSFPDVRLHWLTSKNEKKSLGKLVAITDSLRFRHRPFHDELFKQLRFKTAEVESTRDGLDVRTLELPLGVASMLKLLRSWRVMQLVHFLRLTPLLTLPAAYSVQKSGAIAMLSVPSASQEAFFSGGRAIQRLWLTGTLMGLSMHPLGSLPIFLLQSNPRPEFRASIAKARQGIQNLLPDLGDRVIQLGLRVGYSDPPTARSIRRTQPDVLIRRD